MSNPIVKISVKDYGVITAELYPDQAPVTVANFVRLAKGNFFEGLIFHRVISGFMIQGGGYEPDFSQKNAKAIIGEFAGNGCRTNTISHKRGVLSMARTSNPNSASSQFFIMHADGEFLDGQYAAFGAVTDGIDVVDKIAASETGRLGYFDDVPKTPIIIESISVVE